MDQTIRTLVTPKFSIVGILYPLWLHQHGLDTRLLVLLTAEIELTFSNGVYCGGSLGEQLWGELDHGWSKWRPFQTQTRTRQSNRNCKFNVQRPSPMKPVYQRLNLSVLFSLSFPYLRSADLLARMPTPSLPSNRSAHSPSPYTGPQATLFSTVRSSCSRETRHSPDSRHMQRPTPSHPLLPPDMKRLCMGYLE